MGPIAFFTSESPLYPLHRLDFHCAVQLIKELESGSLRLPVYCVRVWDGTAVSDSLKLAVLASGVFSHCKILAASAISRIVRGTGLQSLQDTGRSQS